MVLYICLFQNIMFAFMPEDDFGIKLKANKKLKKKIEMLFLTLCLLVTIIDQSTYAYAWLSKTFDTTC